MKKETLKIMFTVSGSDENIESSKNGKTTFRTEIKDGNLKVYIYYDVNEKALCLCADVKKDDLVEILLLPYRIELLTNGKIADEEWCVGNCLFEYGDEIKSNSKIDISEIFYEEQELPNVIGRFENAEGWKPEENVFVGDCMPYVTDGRYHVLYLKDRHHHCSKWGMGAHQWNHISTDDFKVWDIHPTAVKITNRYEGSICTGSWIKKEKKEYLFYSIRTADGSAAPISRSISSDGFHFEKDGYFSLILSEKYHTQSVRDPKLFLDDEGVYHMIVTTSLVKENRGCLAHLTSKDLNDWKEETDPFFINSDDEQPECPDLIKYKEFYYLIYSLDAKAHYMFSKNLSGEWEIPQNPIIPCHAVPKGAVWNDKIVFTGFKYETSEYQYAGVMTFKEAKADENGELIFDN